MHNRWGHSEIACPVILVAYAQPLTLIAMIWPIYTDAYDATFSWDCHDLVFKEKWGVNNTTQYGGAATLNEFVLQPTLLDMFAN